MKMWRAEALAEATSRRETRTRRQVEEEDRPCSMISKHRPHEPFSSLVRLSQTNDRRRRRPHRRHCGCTSYKSRRDRSDPTKVQTS